MDIEEIRIKRKIKKLVNGMLQHTTLEHFVQGLDMIAFSMRNLPVCKWEAFIDVELEALERVVARHE